MPIINTVTGLTASLHWGYHRAASVTGWTLTRIENGGWSLAATTADVDDFRVTQRPLVFVAPHATGAWRFPVLELQITGASLLATLGRKE